MKHLTILLALLMAVSVSAEQFYTADDTCKIAHATSIDTSTWGIADSIWYNEPNISGSGLSIWYEDLPTPKKHDTLKEYVTEINEVCDTLWTQHWVPLEELIDGEQYFRQLPKIDPVVCRPDSVWANKTLMYFTPNKLDILKKFLDAPAYFIKYPNGIEEIWVPLIPQKFLSDTIIIDTGLIIH